MDAIQATPAIFGMTGQWELLVIAGVILLVFFGHRIPRLMRSLGRGVTQFKKGLRDDDEAAGAPRGGEEAERRGRGPD